MRFLPNHDAARIVDDDLTLLLNAARANLDNAPLRFRLGFALFQNFGFRIEGIPGEQRIGQLDFVPAERETVFAHIRHTHSGNDRESQRGIDQTLAELSALAVFIVEMNLVGVVG